MKHARCRTSPHRLRRAAAALRRGGVVAHATEGVWGLACNPLDPDAVIRLLELKQRPARRGLILIGAIPEHLAPFVSPAAATAFEHAIARWPGPTTMLLAADSRVPTWLTGEHPTIALRQTAHIESAALCRAFDGALVSTSANVAGRPAARSATQVRARLGHHVDLIAGGEIDRPGRPSTIIDAATGRQLR